MTERDPNVLARRIADLRDELDDRRKEIAGLNDMLAAADAHRALLGVVAEEAKALRKELWADSGVPAEVLSSFDNWMAKLADFEETQ